VGASSSAVDETGKRRHKSFTLAGAAILLFASGAYTGARHLFDSESRADMARGNLLRNSAQTQDFCLDAITGVADTLLLSKLEDAIGAMDPIHLSDPKEVVLPGTELFTGCVASAKLTANVGTISGLDTTEVSLDLLQGSCSLWRGTFEGTWVLTNKLTTLSASVSGQIESEACGQPIDASATGIVAVPEAHLSAQVKITGSVSRSGTSLGFTLENAVVENVDFDVESIDASFIAKGPLGDYNVEKSIEDVVNDEFKSVVAEKVATAANDAIGPRLPLSYP